MTKQFKVVTVSSNTNSFGLKQCIMIAKDGEAYKACINPQFMPERGKLLTVPLSKSLIPEWGQMGFEIPEKMPDFPPKALKELFK